MKRKKVLTAWIESNWYLRWAENTYPHEKMSYLFKNKSHVIYDPHPVKVKITVEEI